MISAIEFGRRHHSCPDAMKWRKSLGRDATQAYAFLVCERGDWLIWQLRKLSGDRRADVRPALHRAIERIVARAIRQGVKSIRGIREQWATDYRRWARRWLSGVDRSAEAAAEAARAVKSERLLQAKDIRREIRAWPGGIEG